MESYRAETSKILEIRGLTDLVLKKKYKNQEVLNITFNDKMKSHLSKGKSYEIIFPTRKEWMNEKNHEIVQFTDGSKTTDGTGAALHNDSYENSIPLGNWTSVFQAEVIAINACAQEMIKDGVMGTSILISSDSQAALKALDKIEINS